MIASTRSRRRRSGRVRTPLSTSAPFRTNAASSVGSGKLQRRRCVFVDKVDVHEIGMAREGVRQSGCGQCHHVLLVDGRLLARRALRDEDVDEQRLTVAEALACGTEAPRHRGAPCTAGPPRAVGHARWSQSGGDRDDRCPSPRQLWPSAGCPRPAGGTATAWPSGHPRQARAREARRGAYAVLQARRREDDRRGGLHRRGPVRSVRKHLTTDMLRGFPCTTALPI